VEGDSQPAYGVLSAATPVARAVLGHSVGDEVTVHAPSGARQMQILAVA
jgi:transcription elongation GreA/GreB family factor